MRLAPLLPIVILSLTASAEKPAVDPSQFTMVVHVVYSSLVYYGNSSFLQQLDVVINGQPMRLEAEAYHHGVLSPADYKAVLSTPNYYAGSKTVTPF